MASKQPRVPKTVFPQTADDLSLIKGIGPALNSRLHKAGIRTYAQLASLSPVELAVRVKGLWAKQIARQDWIGQARKLSRKKASAQHHKQEPVRPMIRQHYENFTIEFLLDGKNATRRTRVVHVQSGDADTWAGWEAAQLVEFLARHANIRVPAPKSNLPQIAAEVGDSLSKIGEPSYSDTKGASLTPLVAAAAELAKPGVVIRPVSKTAPSADPAGTLRLGDLRVMPIDSDAPTFFIQEGQPYHLELTLDLTELTIPNNIPLPYKAIVIFNQLGGSVHFRNEVNGTLTLFDHATIRLEGTSLPSGMYRLEAVVSLFSTKIATGITAFLQGGLLQVYETSLFPRSSESN